MPIHNLGYREWDGERESGNTRWSVIAGIGIRRAWQSSWLRRIAFVVWGPPVAYGILLFLFEQSFSRNGGMDPRGIRDIARVFLPMESLPAILAILDNLNDSSAEELLNVARPLVWKSVFLQLQRTQSIGMIIVVGLCAPSLISHDVRSRAFLLYFSRPLTRFQYIFGKFSTVAFFLLLTCTLPQLLLYVFAVLLSPDVSVVAATWELPLRVVAASLTMIIPTSLLALMFSSLTTESRFATFGWFFVWIFGLAMFIVMRSMNGDTSELVLRMSFLFLLFSDLSIAILGIPTLTSHSDTQFIFVIALSCLCATVIFRKVSAPLRA